MISPDSYASAARVRQLLDERGLTPAQFAVLADLDLGVIEGGLAGTRRFTSLDLALAAAAAGVSVAWLLGEDRVTATVAYRRQAEAESSADGAEAEQAR